MKTIHQSTLIQASPEKLWEVLTEDRYTRDWYAAFSPGSHAITDWKPGSKALFIDESGSGMAARIAESIPGKSLIVAYTGIVKHGVEDLESAEARQYQGGREVYRLSSEGTATRLHVSADMDEAMYEMMSGLWEKAFERLRVLAEQ